MDSAASFINISYADQHERLQGETKNGVNVGIPTFTPRKRMQKSLKLSQDGVFEGGKINRQDLRLCHAAGDDVRIFETVAGADRHDP